MKNRLLSRIVAVILSVCVAVSCFVVPAYAVSALVPVLTEFLEKVFIDYAAGTAAQAIFSSVGTFSELEQQGFLSNLSTDVSGGLIELYVSDDQQAVFVQPASGLSGDQLEMAEYIADSLTTDLSKASLTIYGEEPYSKILYRDLQWVPGTALGSCDLSATSYLYLKTSALKAINGYVAREAYEKRELGAAELEAALGESFPRVTMDLTDPLNNRISFKTSEKNNVTILSKDGFQFSSPFPYASAHYAHGFTTEYIKHIENEFGSYFVQNNGQYWEYTEAYEVYGVTYYFILQDGSLVYMSGYYSGTPGSFTLGLNASHTYNRKYSHEFFDVNGTSLGHLYIDDLHPVSEGLVFNVENQIPSSLPFKVVETLTDDDFTTTTGGEAVSQEFPLTGAEKIAGSAINMGLVSSDPPLTIGEDGTITKIDDIPVEKLESILDAITSGDLNLESIEDYLSLISTLVANGNLTSTEQRKILENVNANTAAGAKDLSQIREALNELTEALTKEYEWEIDDSESEISWITAEHTGFTEAKQLTDELEAVTQSKQLLNNLLNKFDSADDRAPSFSFYWDSDKDGELEEYTVLDLSFMEQTLTNSNLKDKRRFKNGNMTVRSFVHFLIILVSYVSFAIKIIKKLPSLINGAGDFDGDIKTVSFDSRG
ncbi:MAG: hypothetical protein NC084_00060 [Bacteroides sp.]|nr:hypothetical protein [Eubacterium sp.]MCM1417300.1 hypothetical protein [Roseburia sp.]MCM1461080.1 hypothetical protein [Bacteroides sp.]